MSIRSGKAGPADFIVPLAMGLLLSGHCNAARAQPTEAEIFDALKPKAHKRGLARAPDAEERKFIDRLRNRSAHSLTIEEREKAAAIAEEKSSIDLEINFEFNSATVGPQAVSVLLALGRVLSKDEFRGTVFLINGHTDAKGSAAYNRDLSERRAEAVRRLLVEQFRLPADALIAVGYGKERFKNAANPFAAENRRVQVVNVSGR